MEKKSRQLEMFRVEKACFTNINEFLEFINNDKINVISHESSSALTQYVFNGKVEYYRLEKENICKLSYDCKSCDYCVPCTTEDCTSNMCNLNKQCFHGNENNSKCILIELKRI